MDSLGLPLYVGYFTVKIPKNLLKLLGGNPLKLRNAVDKYNEFLEQYGESVSITEDKFHDDEDEFSWVYYTGMSFMFPDEKIVVKVETRSEQMFEQFQQGVRSGSMEIYLKGTAVVSKKDDVENIDRNLLDVSIKKVETYYKGELHSFSPNPDEVLEEINNQKTIMNVFKEKLFEDTVDPNDVPI